MSRRLNDAEQKYGITQLEALGVVWAVAIPGSVLNFKKIQVDYGSQGPAQASEHESEHQPNFGKVVDEA